MSAARVPISGLHLDGDGPYNVNVRDLPPTADDNRPVRVVRVPVNDATGTFVIFGSPAQIARFAAEVVAAIEAHDAEPPDLVEALGEALDEVTARAEAEPATVDDVAQALTDVSGRPWAVATDEGDR